MIQDIQNSTIRQECYLAIDNRQLKICCTCYDLSNALLRVLEMIIHYNASHILTTTNNSYNCLDTNSSKRCLNGNELFNDNYELNLKNYFGGIVDELQDDVQQANFNVNDAANLIDTNSNFDADFSKSNPHHFSFENNFKLEKNKAKDKLFCKQETNEILLQQLCTLCNQIINRVMMSSKCFKYVRQLTNSDSINEFHILSSLIAILIELIVRNEKTRYLTLNLLINDLNFQLAPYLSLIDGFEKSADGCDSSKEKSNFIKFSQFLNEDEFKELKRMLNYMISFNERNEKSLDDYQEEDLCTICYSNPKTAILLPCLHHSCRSCITIHLLRNQECFFCKIPLEKVQLLDQVIYPQKIKKKSLISSSFVVWLLLCD